MTQVVIDRSLADQFLHDCDESGCTHHEAFRYWSVDAEEELPLGAPYISSQTGFHLGWPSGQAIIDECAKSRERFGSGPVHDAPDPDCTCGIRVTFELPHLASMVLAEYRLRQGVPEELLANYGGRFDEVYLDQIALGAVGVRGRIVDGSPEDPAGIFRVQRAQIFGPLYLPAPLAKHRDRIAEVYHAPVETRRARGLSFLATFLPARQRRVCQACGSTAMVRDGLCVSTLGCFDRLRKRMQAGERL